jgi:hypothetical protein
VVTEGNPQNSPKASSQAQLRTRIISPRRQKFEKQFEKYMETKYVTDPIE